MAGPRIYRVPVSSPPDVFGERERFERVIGRLNGEWGSAAPDLANPEWQHLAVGSEHDVALDLGQAGDHPGEFDHASRAFEAGAAARRQAFIELLANGCRIEPLDAGVALKFLKRDDEAKVHLDQAKALLSKAGSPEPP